jgi:hypothetical protein
VIELISWRRALQILFLQCLARPFTKKLSCHQWKAATRIAIVMWLFWNAQPHCYLLHSIALNSGDATGETTLKTTTMDELTWRHFDEFREFGDWVKKCQVRVQKLESARQLNPM